jgi:hypothetical protein
MPFSFFLRFLFTLATTAAHIRFFHPVVTPSRLGSMLASVTHSAGSAHFSAGSTACPALALAFFHPPYNTTGHVEQKNRQGFAAR